jgi:hypothetical protein
VNSEQPPQRTALAYSAGILGSLLLVALLVWAIIRYAQPPPVENRSAERAKALAELRAAEAEALAKPAWVDKAKGVVRLPIDQAVQMVERDWGKDAATARSNLLARAAKAFAVPPKAPEKPSEFE